MPKITDVIHHKNQYSIQQFVVLDAMPQFKYERHGNILVGEDSGFFNFFQYEHPSKNFEAFGGRKFNIPLVGGGVEKAFGQWWDCFPYDYQELLYSVGSGTIHELKKCNVFSGMKVDMDLLDGWLLSNEPSNNYYKYDPKSKEYGLHRIDSRF